MQQKVLNNRYELERKIGEGGMARVYLGRDLRLNRRVAVKVLHQHYAADRSFLSRFHHEAQAAANLHHPNIVDIYDVGQDRDIHYIVMEYVDGSDLKSEILRRGALPIDEAIAIGVAVAEGLESAHRIGMVHRDVKPQNILLGRDGEVKITDFGIAKSAFSTAMTETGVTFGTADYLSPEQARGQPATPQSDIYSLGVTLYEALTGRLPFAGENAVAVAMQHVSETPPPLRMYAPRVPVHLESLVLQAMSKDPAQRPESAIGFARMLRAQRSMSEQDTIVSPRSPRTPNVPDRRPAPTPVTPRTPRTTLPPPPVVRTNVPAPSTGGAGVGLGAFMIGLLLLGVVLAGIYLFASGTFDNILLSAAPTRPTRPSIGSTASPEAPTATLAPGVTPSATLSPTPGTPTPTVIPDVVMPLLVGLEANQVRDLLLQSNLASQEGVPRYSDTVLAGVVLDQFPQAGQIISATTVVTYAVSLGPETVALPDVSGLRVANARLQLQQLGFNVAIVEESSNTVSEGFVIRSEPAPGLRPAKGETITLVVSMGNKVIMPEVVGLPLEEARRQIEQAGLFVSFADEQGCDRLPA
ncbi:MAG TPA: protein kinase, partial [Roseiflexaceae bacterium]|nr:protein kinase [Roseiflexaceae bacterium]